MRFGIRWYQGFGEHDYIEASSAEYATLPELFSAMLGSEVSEEDLFTALVDGQQDVIYWITDDLGFELFMA